MGGTRASRSRPSPIGWGKTLCFSALTTLLLLLLIEGSLRLYVRAERDEMFGKALPIPMQRHVYQVKDAILGYALKPGYDAGGIRVNSLGFRGPEISLQKPPGVYRIVMVGDSCTFGLAGDDCPYPAQLQGLLAQPGRRFTYEVVNAGIEGYSSIYGLKLLEYRVFRLQPDMVMIYIGWNDLYGIDPTRPQIAGGLDGPGTGEPTGAADVGARIMEPLNRLYLAQFLRRIISVDIPRLAARFDRQEGQPEQAIDPAMAQAYRWRLARMIQIVRAMHATPVLMTLPTVLSEDMSPRALSIVHYPEWAHRDRRYFLQVVNAFNETIRDVARGHGALLIDNARYFDGLGREKERLFFDSLHMYCEGYRLIAENIQRELARQGLAP